ncbi:preprotein translocase subunit YajC [Nocardioides pocheonensis]|uniref:preprotein translocase subunit YajC n=1 Tax=Nocardioides pocheonensis TaxID=661485 RepID=UPI00160AEBAD|nr:preprotein translocase subunit YajC [Nocardioides pocheonensis]
MPAELQLLVIVIALFGFWAIVMRPARVQQRRVAQLQEELAVGDEVIISAGIFGTVVSIDDDRVQLEIAPGTVVTAARQVVIRRAPEVPEAQDAAPQDAGPDDGPHDSTTEED